MCGLLYVAIGEMYFTHNKNMGHWLPGLIVSIVWFIVTILWIIGFILVYREEQEIKKIMKLDKETNQ